MVGSTASNSIESEHGERESDAAYINLFGANQTTGFIESAAIATERERETSTHLLFIHLFLGFGLRSSSANKKMIALHNNKDF